MKRYWNLVTLVGVLFAAFFTAWGTFAGRGLIASTAGVGLVFGMIANPLLLADIINTFHPDAVANGYSQLKLVWRHHKIFFTAAAGDALLFQVGKANYVNNNTQAGFLGNFYGVYFWAKAMVGTSLASQVWIAASTQQLWTTDIEIHVAGKAYIPRTNIMPYLSDIGFNFNSTPLATATGLSGISQDGSPCFVAYRPNETFEGHAYWAGAYVATDFMNWGMLGVEASKVEQG